jgi:transformation/transcription domain-associated protein
MNIRINAFEAIQERLVPNHILLDYVTATYPSFADFWLFRRQFAYQLAGLSFLTYILHMRDRNPARMNIARATGNMWGSEFTPSFHPQRPMFHNNEQVPFRLTPNLQMLLGPIALEGVFSASMLVIAKALTEPDATKLEQQLSIFIRDEITYHLTAAHRPNLGTTELRVCVQANAASVMNRAKSLAIEPSSGGLPANQTVLDSVAKAVDPRKLSQMDPLWMPYL